MTKKTVAVSSALAAVALSVGIAVGIGGASAASDKSKDSAPGGHRGLMERHHDAGPPGAMGMKMHGGPPVHAELVVPNKAGDAFVTVTGDNGKVISVNGRSLAIEEGTDKLKYKDVTLEVPESATIYRNFKKANLGDLKAGDRVHVSTSPDETVVFATDRAPDASDRPDGAGFHPGGPGGGPMPGGRFGPGHMGGPQG